MHTSKHSAYSELSDKMFKFLNYNSTVMVWNKITSNFIKLSISLCEPKDSGYGYKVLHASQEVHLAYLKKHFPEVYFLAVYYLHLKNCRHKGHPITDEQLDNLCYDAFVSLSNRISGLSNKHEMIHCSRLLNDWTTGFNLYVMYFLTTWWSDIAEMVYGEEITTGIGKVYDTEFPRIGRVLNRLVKNNIPFMSVIVNIMLRAGTYGKSSGVCRILAMYPDNSKYRVVKNNSGNLGEMEPYARIMGNAITQEYLDSELVVSILWINRISNIIPFDEEYSSSTIFWISIEPELFFYKNFNLKCFNNINDELIDSVKNHETSINFVDEFIQMAFYAHDCFIEDDSVVDIEIPDSFKKYMNYMKLKRKVRY